VPLPTCFGRRSRNGTRRPFPVPSSKPNKWESPAESRRETSQPFNHRGKQIHFISHPPHAFSRDAHFCARTCACRTVITRHDREAVVVRRLPSVARAVRMVRMFVPPSQHPPRRSSACPMQMNSLSSVARPPHLKLTGTIPIRGRRLRRCYRHLPCGRTRQNRMLRRLKSRNSFDHWQVWYVLVQLEVRGR
jgi:hypothetical protein